MNSFCPFYVLVAADTKEVKTAQRAAPAKPKVAAKAPAKPLPQMMEEDVIPQLKAILETQDELSDIELSFQDNKVSYLLLCNLKASYYKYTTLILWFDSK